MDDFDHVGRGSGDNKDDGSTESEDEGIEGALLRDGPYRRAAQLVTSDTNLLGQHSGSSMRGSSARRKGAFDDEPALTDHGCRTGRASLHSNYSAPCSETSISPCHRRPVSLEPPPPIAPASESPQGVRTQAKQSQPPGPRLSIPLPGSFAAAAVGGAEFSGGGGGGGFGGCGGGGGGCVHMAAGTALAGLRMARLSSGSCSSSCGKGGSDSKRLRGRSGAGAGRSGRDEGDAPSEGKTFPSFRALHVEDDLFVQQVLGLRLFGKLGCRVDRAETGVEALKKVLASDIGKPPPPCLPGRAAHSC